MGESNNSHLRAQRLVQQNTLAHIECVKLLSKYGAPSTQFIKCLRDSYKLPERLSEP
jgi:hypothetical protein